MAISCGAKCAKSILITFNLLFWLSGCTLLVLGVWLILEPAKGHLLHAVAPADTPPTLHLYLAYVLIGLGGVVLLVGFVGCCGALQESKCLVATYFLFLLLLLAAELGLAVAALMFREHAVAGAELRLTDRLRRHYGHHEQHVFSQAVDFTQYKFNCCGIHGDDDYLASSWLNESLSNGSSDDKIKSVPTTCCVLNNANVSYYAGSPISVVSRVFYGNVEEAWQNPQPRHEGACQAPDPRDHEHARHSQGCIGQLEAWFKRESAIIIIAGLGTAALEVLGMVFSVCLCRNLTDDI